MNKKEKNFATYKEFAKMLREVANIYSKLGDEPLLEEGYEYDAIRDAVQYVTNKHDFSFFLLPWSCLLYTSSGNIRLHSFYVFYT